MLKHQMFFFPLVSVLLVCIHLSSGIVVKVSAIDPASEEGERPDTLVGNIEFSDVVFSYPARPDVQVFVGCTGSVCDLNV